MANLGGSGEGLFLARAGTVEAPLTLDESAWGILSVESSTNTRSRISPV